jgi:thioredoxin-like negative regulator of GroEL
MIERLLAADAAMGRGELDHAERLFAQVVEADARNAIAVVGLARVAWSRGAAEDARGLAQRALDIDPQEAAARRLLDELAGSPVAVAASVAEPSPDPPQMSAPAPPPSPGSAPPATPRSGWRAWLARLLRRG